MTIEISPPEGHRFVETEDGSWTLFSEAFQEACHSTTGARAETLLHYIQGCRILEKAKIHSPLVVLEIGFGLGIGLLTTL
jgi:tRNA U34 5-methylaminomethyl-2-thiouridine-forming methyltransferase MnmC